MPQQLKAYPRAIQASYFFGEYCAHDCCDADLPPFPQTCLTPARRFAIFGRDVRSVELPAKWRNNRMHGTDGLRLLGDPPPSALVPERRPTEMNLIRVANSLDLEQAARIYRSSMQMADWLPGPSRIKNDFASATVGEDVFVAVNSERGVTGFVSVWTPESFVHHLYVDSAFQNLGIGTELLASLREWLPQPWTLKCVSANRQAMSFYISRGWISVRTEHGPDGEYHLMRFAQQSGNEIHSVG